ncbi:MAG: hypothetical protein RI932_1107 [Pseudomonadota bacterium]|jgi:hypothetical protein
MKAFENKNLSIQDFVKKVESALEGRDLGQIARFKLQGSELLVIFSKLGTTELKYKIDPDGSGFKASLVSEKVALTHRPLKADITARLARVMEREGAQCTL